MTTWWIKSRSAHTRTVSVFMIVIMQSIWTLPPAKHAHRIVFCPNTVSRIYEHMLISSSTFGVISMFLSRTHRRQCLQLYSFRFLHFFLNNFSLYWFVWCPFSTLYSIWCWRLAHCSLFCIWSADTLHESRPPEKWQNLFFFYCFKTENVN